MLASYPVIPLARGQALAVGLTSYDGGVHYGLNGDREAMADLDDLRRCIVESLAELRGGRAMTQTPGGVWSSAAAASSGAPGWSARSRRCRRCTASTPATRR